MQETQVWSLAQEDPLEKEMARIPVWEIPWTKEPGGLQNMGSQKSQTRLSDLSIAVQELWLHSAGATVRWYPTSKGREAPARWLTLEWWWSGGCVALEQQWGDAPCPRTKEKPQQEGRRCQVAFTIKPHTWESHFPGRLIRSLGVHKERGVWNSQGGRKDKLLSLYIP